MIAGQRKKKGDSLVLKILSLASSILLCAQAFATDCPEAFKTEFRKLHSKDTANLCELHKAGKATLIVNTASHCGFTNQFSGLEELHQKYKEEGLVIIGFPSNDFKQEEKEEAETARVCYQNYGVTFIMAQHAPVRGSDAHPTFKYLATETKAPSWNFNKYLITSDGEVEHFGSRTKPLGSKLEESVAKTLSF